MTPNGKKVEAIIIERAKDLGASQAGIAWVAALKTSPSYAACGKRLFYPECKGVEWDEKHKSVLVWTLVHPASEPILDW